MYRRIVILRRFIDYKIKDQELQEDLRHNYVYQILFENWKKKHKALSPYDSVEMKLPDLINDPRTRRDQWIENDEEMLEFPSSSEIDKMKINTDFLNIDKLNETNLERLKTLDKGSSKPEDFRYKFDINVLDDKLFGKLDQEREKEAPFEVRPMYNTNTHRDNNTDDRKVYANTLRSDGEFDDTFSRASDGLQSGRKSVRFDDTGRSSNRSVLNRESDRRDNYNSPFKMASKMITS